MMMSIKLPKMKHPVLYALLAVVFLINLVFWSGTRYVRAAWENVPYPPSKDGIVMAALGDQQLAYRVLGMMLQNFGEIGGRSTKFEDYNYKNLGKWFFLADQLDPKSNFVPLLAAYYFGATKNKDDLNHVIDYLAHIGKRPYGQHWRWLSQAVFIAKFQQEDHEKALSLAYELADLWTEDMPGWAKQMPAFILADMGQKEAAMALLLGLIQEGADKFHPAEVNFMHSYICERILTAQEAQAEPICQVYYQ